MLYKNRADCEVQPFNNRAIRFKNTLQWRGSAFKKTGNSSFKNLTIGHENTMFFKQKEGRQEIAAPL
ncbi:MAG: hypothetical protein RSF77_03585 [Oscillospiraceae bacterium]